MYNRALEEKHLLRVEDNFKRGVEKYTHRFCNTNFSELQFDEPQFAIVCLLLLRGPQTPGELRARSGRLHEFADNNAVVESLNGLIEREGLAKEWPDGVARWRGKAPLGRLGVASDVADAVLFLLSDGARWISGANLVVDGGMSAVSKW